MNETDLIAMARPIAWRRGTNARLSVEEREDLLQDVLTKYVAAWPDGTPANTEAWLETVTANALIDRKRAAARRPIEVVDQEEDDPVAGAIGLLRSSEYASLSPVVEELLSRVFGLISADDAHLLRRRHLDGASATDLADELGISVSNAEKRTTRARARLRAALMDRPDLVAELSAGHPHVY